MHACKQLLKLLLRMSNSILSLRTRAKSIMSSGYFVMGSYKTTWTHYPDSQQTSLCSYSLIQCLLAEKQHMYSL